MLIKLALESEKKNFFNNFIYSKSFSTCAFNFGMKYSADIDVSDFDTLTHIYSVCSVDLLCYKACEMKAEFYSEFLN